MNSKCSCRINEKQGLLSHRKTNVVKCKDSVTNSSTESLASNHEDHILKLLWTKALLGYSCYEFYLWSLWGRVGGICPPLPLSPIVLWKKILILRWKLIKSSHCNAWLPICQKCPEFCMPNWQIISVSGTWNTMRKWQNSYMIYTM